MNAPERLSDDEVAEINAPERLHAVLSASGAKRWLSCPPSARLEEGFPDSTSEFAALGTFLHEVCEMQLRRWLDRVDAETYNGYCLKARADPRFTADFMAAGKVYVELAQAKITAAREINPDAVILLEDRLDFSHLVPEGFGTGDLVIIADGVLEVVDLKGGVGVIVSAIDNPQLKLYGAGAVEAYSLLYDFDTVRLTISQPRVSEEPSSWDISVADLAKWGQEVVIPAAKLAWDGKGAFASGDHCQFCRAKGPCRARAEANLALAAHEFLPAELLSDDEVADILTKAAQLKAWAGDIQAFAMSRAAAGHKIKGWKLVRGRSIRVYKDQDAVAKKLTEAGIPEASIYERSLLGITAMEKAITKKRFTELLADLIVKPAGKPTLVESSDPRAEVEASALDGFDNLESGDSES